MAEGASADAAATVTLKWTGGRPTKIRMVGTISTTIRIATTIMAPDDRGHQQRHADNAAEARAIQREADRHAALVVEPEAERIGDDPETGAGPAESKHGIGGVKLPRLGDLADQDGGRRHRYHPRQQAVARAEGTDRLADERDQQRTEQIEEGRAA